MSLVTARVLATRLVSDIACELQNSVTESEILDFLQSSSSTILSIRGLTQEQIAVFQDNSNLNTLCGKNNSLLLTGTYKALESVKDDTIRHILVQPIENLNKNYSPPILSLCDINNRTVVMGILNVTPDSFSDGGRFLAPGAAVEHAIKMLNDGADIIDIGGESTRPGSLQVDKDEEIRRIVPVIEAIKKETDAVISVDTNKSRVALAACTAGAKIINDISGGLMDPDMPKVAADTGAEVVLMHMQGTPQNMQTLTNYNNIIGDIYEYLADRVICFINAGCSPNSLIIDPGFGFSKTPRQNLEILRRLFEFKSLGCPLLIGTSRKSTIGKVLGGLPESDRLEGTAATVSIAIANGADIIRVHDVKEMTRVARMTDAIIGKLIPKI